MLQQSLPMNDERPQGTLRFRTFTIAEVSKKLNNLKPNKGRGPDGIHVNFLRNTSAFSEPLYEMFNDSIFSDILPQERWKYNSPAQGFSSVLYKSPSSDPNQPGCKTLRTPSAGSNFNAR